MGYIYLTTNEYPFFNSYNSFLDNINDKLENIGFIIGGSEGAIYILFNLLKKNKLERIKKIYFVDIDKHNIALFLYKLSSFLFSLNISEFSESLFKKDKINYLFENGLKSDLNLEEILSLLNNIKNQKEISISTNTLIDLDGFYKINLLQKSKVGLGQTLYSIKEFKTFYNRLFINQKTHLKKIKQLLEKIIVLNGDIIDIEGLDFLYLSNVNDWLLKQGKFGDLNKIFKNNKCILGCSIELKKDFLNFIKKKKINIITKRVPLYRPYLYLYTLLYPILRSKRERMLGLVYLKIE